jgi:hypothetical protein
VFNWLQAGLELFSWSIVMSALNLARKKRENLARRIQNARPNQNIQNLFNQWSAANGELQDALLKYIPNSIVQKANNGQNAGIKNKELLQAVINSQPKNSLYTTNFVIPQIKRFLNVAERYKAAANNARKAGAQETGEDLALKNKRYTEALQAIINATKVLNRENRNHNRAVAEAEASLAGANMANKLVKIRDVLIFALKAKNFQLQAARAALRAKNAEHNAALREAANNANAKLKNMEARVAAGNATAAELRGAQNAAAAAHAEQLAARNAALKGAAETRAAMNARHARNLAARNAIANAARVQANVARATANREKRRHAKATAMINNMIAKGATNKAALNAALREAKAAHNAELAAQKNAAEAARTNMQRAHTAAMNARNATEQAKAKTLMNRAAAQQAVVIATALAMRVQNKANANKALRNLKAARNSANKEKIEALEKTHAEALAAAAEAARAASEQAAINLASQKTAFNALQANKNRASAANLAAAKANLNRATRTAAEAAAAAAAEAAALRNAAANSNAAKQELENQLAKAQANAARLGVNVRQLSAKFETTNRRRKEIEQALTNAHARGDETQAQLNALTNARNKEARAAAEAQQALIAQISTLRTQLNTAPKTANLNKIRRELTAATAESNRLAKALANASASEAAVRARETKGLANAASKLANTRAFAAATRWSALTNVARMANKPINNFNSFNRNAKLILESSNFNSARNANLKAAYNKVAASKKTSNKNAFNNKLKTWFLARQKNIKNAASAYKNPYWAGSKLNPASRNAKKEYPYAKRLIEAEYNLYRTKNLNSGIRAYKLYLAALKQFMLNKAANNARKAVPPSPSKVNKTVLEAIRKFKNWATRKQVNTTKMEDISKKLQSGDLVIHNAAAKYQSKGTRNLPIEDGFVVKYNSLKYPLKAGKLYLVEPRTGILRPIDGQGIKNINGRTLFTVNLKKTNN